MRLESLLVLRNELLGLKGNGFFFVRNGLKSGLQILMPTNGVIG